MSFQVFSLILVSVCSLGSQEFDAKELAKKVSDDVPDEPSFVLEEYTGVIQHAVALELIEQGRRVRDATLTLIASRAQVRDPDDGAEDILESLGPGLRSELVPVFLAWLADDDNPAMRIQAWFALQNIDAIPGSQIPTLRELASHKSSGKRRQIAALLPLCEKKVAADPEFLKLLHDPVPSVQIKACESLLTLDPNSTEPLAILLKLAAGYDEKHASRAVDLLAACVGWREHEAEIRDALDRVRMRSEVSSFAWRADPERVAVLGKWLLDERSTKAFRLAILKSFRNVHGDASRAKKSVLKVLRDFDTAYRVAAIRALGDIGDFNANELRNRAEDGPAERNAIARALGSCSGESAPDARTMLLGLMKDEPKGVRQSACASLCQLGDVPDEAVDCVRAMLIEGTAHDQMKGMELVPLMGARGKSLVPALMKIMDDGKIFGFAFGHAELNWISSRTLVEIGKPAIPELLKGLKHANPDVRRLAAGTLGEIGDVAAVDPLFQALETERDGPRNEDALKATLRAIADTIENYENAESKVDYFAQLLEMDWSRSAAIRALGSIGPSAQRVVPVLLKLEGRGFAPDRYELARTLSRLRPEGSIGLLGIRRALKAASEERSFSSFEHFDLADTIDLIVELGERSKPLIPDLKFMVEEHEFLHREHRMQAAYALARIEPDNPRWRQHLERWAAMGIPVHPAETRLELLKANTE